MSNNLMAAREPLDYRSVQEKYSAAQITSISSNSGLEKALAYGKEALGNHPNSSLILYEMGLANNRANRLKEAMAHYNEALVYNSELIPARFDRAELRLLNNDVDGAKADLKAIIEQDSNHWGVHLRLAQIAGAENTDDAFSEHLIAAVENGFQLRSLSALGQPWTDWIHDSRKSRLIRRIVLLYANGELWNQLQR